MFEILKEQKEGVRLIYTDEELKKKIYEMMESFESEVVEFKEATNSYSFNEIGRYFSALGNEANIRGLKEAWLVFGKVRRRCTDLQHRRR